MSQRDVNTEGLEKSFATNVLGQSSVGGEVWRQLMGRREGDSSDSFFFYRPLGVYILTKSLIPLLEKSADPRVVSPSNTSCVSFPPSQPPAGQTLWTPCASKTLMNASQALLLLVNVIHHFNEHLMGLGRGYLIVHCCSQHWDMSSENIIKMSKNEPFRHNSVSPAEQIYCIYHFTVTMVPFSRSVVEEVFK